MCGARADRNQGGVGDLAYPLVSDLKREITQKYNVLTPTASRCAASSSSTRRCARPKLWRRAVRD